MIDYTVWNQVIWLYIRHLVNLSRNSMFYVALASSETLFWTGARGQIPVNLKPGFQMIVGDRSRSLGSLVNCSVIVTIIWKPNFHFASDRQRPQRLPTIATITFAGIESESISAIVAIVNDSER